MSLVHVRSGFAIVAAVTRSRMPLVVAALVTMPVAANAQTQKVPAECQPLVEAQLKQVTTPNHMYMTSRGAIASGQTRTAESITVGNATYVMTQANKWVHSPVSPQELLESKRENLTTYKKMSCKRLADDVVSGVAANVYETYLETGDATITGKIWVGKSLGLPVKSESDMDVGGTAGKSHTSTRIEYTNVHAPT